MAFLHLIIHFFLVGSVLCAEGPIVNTPLGSIQGVYSTESRNFNGIKFAQAPIGPLRWKPPVAVTSWSPALYNASHVKPGCPQTNCYLVNPSSVCPTQMSEDCLHLNVFTPLDVTNSSRLPVMVFLHGGNFVHMDGGSALFRGDVFVNKSGVILVTTNYRLGVLGFLVTNQGSDRAQGNYGIQDQRLMMEWVRDNILGFGGDPEEIDFNSNIYFLTISDVVTPERRHDRASSQGFLQPWINTAIQ